MLVIQCYRELQLRRDLTPLNHSSIGCGRGVSLALAGVIEGLYPARKAAMLERLKRYFRSNLLLVSAHGTYGAMHTIAAAPPSPLLGMALGDRHCLHPVWRRVWIRTRHRTPLHLMGVDVIGVISRTHIIASMRREGGK